MLVAGVVSRRCESIMYAIAVNEMKDIPMGNTQSDANGALNPVRVYRLSKAKPVYLNTPSGNSPSKTVAPRAARDEIVILAKIWAYTVSPSRMTV